ISGTAGGRPDHAASTLFASSPEPASRAASGGVASGAPASAPPSGVVPASATGGRAESPPPESGVGAVTSAPPPSTSGLETSEELAHAPDGKTVARKRNERDRCVGVLG